MRTILNFVDRLPSRTAFYFGVGMGMILAVLPVLLLELFL
jgi:hypothetical protein